MGKRNQHTIKPGEIRNPRGRPKTVPEIKQIRQLNIEQLHSLVNKYLKMSFDELKVAYANHETPVLDLCVISIMKECIKKGDYSRLDFFLNRLVGPVKQKVDHSGELITGSPIVNVVLPSNGRTAEENNGD